jgi:pyruvate,orthophosphate dikinase
VGITTPEIYNMQAEAILRAACELKKENVNAKPHIMIPLIGHIEEMKLIKKEIEKLATNILKEMKTNLSYKIGTMIEIPRACVTADEIATEAEFFSFGTNDLTQMTFGFSRDDAGKFLPSYDQKNILERNPFQTIDQKGVGELMKIAVKKGRKSRPDMSIGICGEQGGDPRSIQFCHQIGLDYVSASPFRVPIARLAAAQAALND